MFRNAFLFSRPFLANYIPSLFYNTIAEVVLDGSKIGDINIEQVLNEYFPIVLKLKMFAQKCKQIKSNVINFHLFVLTMAKSLIELEMVVRLN